MIKPHVVLTFGADPELFFQKNGDIIGSERIIPFNGLGSIFAPVVVRDGIQCELHPMACSSIRGLADNISKAFIDLNFHLASVKNQIGDVQFCWDTLVEVNKSELDSLSDESRILGCKPSKNFYKDRPITVPEGYPKRSAAGHMHLGLQTTELFKQQERDRLIPLLDIFVGQFGVLFDRDPGAAERREHYGRAGEFRYTSYGIEYRALSNFWLRNFTLFNLMFGMSRVAVAILEQTLRGEDLESELIDVVDIGKVVQAIDTNDWELARKNVEDLRPFLMKHLPQDPTLFPICPSNFDRMLAIAEGINTAGMGGLSYYFPAEPVRHWINRGFVDFNTYAQKIW